ncbi:MAG: SET domain-containing protein [Patescibacteria group bacterium]
MSKQKLLDHLKSDVYCRIGRSDVHGIGIIAIRDIPKGINPFKSFYEESYEEFTDDELVGLPPEVRKLIHDYCAEENDSVWIPKFGFNQVHILHYINHSTNPNVIPVDDSDIFITTKDIAKGEELFSNYATYDEDYEKKM